VTLWNYITWWNHKHAKHLEKTSHAKVTNQFSYAIFMSLVCISYISQSYSLTKSVQTDFISSSVHRPGEQWQNMINCSVLQKTSNTRNECIRQSKKICNLCSSHFVRKEVMAWSMEKWPKQSWTFCSIFKNGLLTSCWSCCVPSLGRARSNFNTKHNKYNRHATTSPLSLSLVTEVKKKYLPEDGQKLTETCWTILRLLKQYDQFNVLF